MKNYLVTYPRVIRLVMITTVGFLLTQCEHGDKLAPSSSTVRSPLAISSDYALKVASAFNNNADNRKARVSANDQEDSLTVDKTETYNKDGLSIFHLLSYKNNRGWMIVSADRRVTPILAYSHTGKFDLANLGDGAKAWVEGVARLSKKAQSAKSFPTDIIEARWKYFEKNMKTGTPNGRVADGNCSSYDQYIHQCPQGNIYAHQGYPTSTLVGNWGSSWQQYYGYTYSLPDVDQTVPACSGCGNKSLTGCGPLAISMVLLANNRNKSVYKPSGYNFDLMPNSIVNGCGSMSSGEIALSSLIQFAFYYANAGYIPFSCSVPTTPGNIPTVFSAAGYSNSGSMQDFYNSQSLLKNDLHQGYPVVMSGMTCSTCLGTWHIWVVDGFHEDTFYNLDCSGSSPVCVPSGFLYYSIKWGHANSGNADGWYAFNNFVENGDLYDTNLKVNVGARP